jgi:hypothetical protein
MVVSGINQFAQASDHILVGQLVATPGSEHGVDNQWDIRVVGDDPGDHRDILAAAEEADLESRNRHVLQNTPRLILDTVRSDCQNAAHADRILHGQRRHHRQGMAADRRKGHQVGLQPGPPGGIAGGEGKNDGRGGASVHGGKLASGKHLPDKLLAAARGFG